MRRLEYNCIEVVMDDSKNAAGLNNIADATYDVAVVTAQAGHSIGKAIAMPDHWGKL
jgi:hypothetical protein